MELRQLESFVAVAEELHFGRAAQRVHLSQPALSQQIKRLEDDLGFALFNRTRRRVELTAAGAAFLASSRQLLADAERAVTLAARAATGDVGSLRIGYVGSALLSVVPPVIRALREAAPQIELSLTERKTAEQLAAMRDDRLDVGFIHQPADPPQGFEVTPIFKECVGVAIAEDDPLAARNEIALGDLAQRPFVLFPRALEPDTYDTLVGACAASGFTPAVAQEATSLQTILGLVASGLGTAFVAESVMTGTQRDGVAFRRLEASAPEITTAIAWRDDTDNPSIGVFRRVVDATLNA